MGGENERYKMWHPGVTKKRTK